MSTGFHCILALLIYIVYIYILFRIKLDILLVQADGLGTSSTSLKNTAAVVLVQTTCDLPL